MATLDRAWEHALDQPGSAGPRTLLHAKVFSVAIILMAVTVAIFGRIPLVPLPQFTTFHASFVFLADSMTAFLLFGQFAYRPNRRLLLEGLAHTLAQAARYGHSTAVLFLDLDYFKDVNDTYGHDVGDALLKEVAIRLMRCVRAGDTVSRLGGDEFVIVLPEISSPRDAAVVADKALDMLSEKMVIMGHPIEITGSIGITICDKGHCLNADELLRRADQAMYAAKKAGRNQISVGTTFGER